MNSPIKGYKATYNYKCRDQHFEIGKVYELEGEPIMCVNGFHFCPNTSYVLWHCSYIPNDFKLLEVEALGDIVEEGGKSCTNKIKIIREVPMEEWDFYKDLPNGHCEIHYKDFDGSEYWNEYNEKGRIVHHKNSKGYESWIEYNEKGNEIYYKDSDGVEEWKIKISPMELKDGNILKILMDVNIGSVKIQATILL